MNEIADLRAAADKGDPAAQLALAQRLITGSGVDVSLEQAMHLIDAARAQGSPDAHLFDSVLFARGIGRPRSMKEAYACLRSAAAQGSALANLQMTVLGGDELDSGPWKKPIHLEPLAMSPRIYAVESFVPDAACAWLINAARQNLKPTRIYREDGSIGPDRTRSNSASMFSHLASDLVLQLTCRRVATATGTALENQEPCNVLRYGPGQQYLAHFDFFPPIEPGERDDPGKYLVYGQRVATALVYLNDEYVGGETSFPHLKLNFKGRRGDALIFWNVSEDGACERNSLHAGLPIVRGEKWLLSQWIREKPHALV